MNLLYLDEQFLIVSSEKGIEFYCLITLTVRYTIPHENNKIAFIGYDSKTQLVFYYGNHGDIYKY